VAGTYGGLGSGCTTRKCLLEGRLGVPAEPEIEEGDAADEWHRKTGARLFNGAWDLIDKTDRSDDDSVEMLLRAFASRWHWGQVGGSLQISSGDWQIAHVASLMGLDQLALLFAARCLGAVEADHGGGWRLASAHEGMARAYASAGDAEGRALHMRLADEALAAEPEEEERVIIAGQLATVPEV
jgi:hypothetical protein